MEGTINNKDNILINAIHCVCPNCNAEFDITPPENTHILKNAQEDYSIEIVEFINENE